MNTPVITHITIKKLDDTLTLRGRRSHAKHRIPINVSTRPSAVKMMQE
jgi:hypothetical protein